MNRQAHVQLATTLTKDNLYDYHQIANLKGFARAFKIDIIIKKSKPSNINDL